MAFRIEYTFQVLQMFSIERILCKKGPEYQILLQIGIALESLIKTLPMVLQTIQLKPQLKMNQSQRYNFPLDIESKRRKLEFCVLFRIFEVQA